VELSVTDKRFSFWMEWVPDSMHRLGHAGRHRAYRSAAALLFLMVLTGGLLAGPTFASAISSTSPWGPDHSLPASGSAPGHAETRSEAPAVHRPATGVPGSNLANVPTGTSPQTVTYDPINGDVYVANFQSDNVSVINGTSAVGNVTVGNGPEYAAFDSADGEIYVANSGSNNVSLLSGTTVVGTVAVGADPGYATFDSANDCVYISNYASDNVSVLSGATVIATLNVSVGPSALTYDPGNGFVYVSNTGSDNVSVLNGTTVAGSVIVGVGPGTSAYDPENGFVYVPNYASNNVSVINGNATVASLAVGVDPEFVTYGGSGLIYVSNTITDDVSVVQGTAVTGNVTAGTDPGSAAFDNANGLVYLSNSVSDNVTVINGATPVASIDVGIDPGFSAFDPGNGYVYVSNTGSNSVSVIGAAPPTIYALTFAEAGLGPGASWTVALNGTAGSSTTSTIAFNGSNGTYPFTVDPVPGYTISPSSGSVVVDGAATLTNITFTPVPAPKYSVIFTETGLPAGTAWSVSFNGTGKGSRTSSISFSEPNGTYGFSTTGIPGYVENPGNGSVTVNGSAVAQPIAFAAEIAPVYTLSFAETGLPDGTSWSVAVNGTPATSRNPQIDFTELNGTYVFTIPAPAGFTADPSSGRVTLSGAGANETIRFTSITVPSYAITFTESGLPSGTNWTVGVNGTGNTSVSSTIVFRLTNGSYLLSVESGNRSWMPVYPPNLRVAGGPQDLPIDFSEVTYSITLAENGLPSGTNWSLTVGSLVRSTTATSVVLFEPNGTYVVTTSVPAGGLHTGSFTVGGSSATVPLDFHAISFTETGLPQGASWVVTTNNVTQNTTAPSIVFYLASGSYSYSIGKDSGFTAVPATGYVNIPGAPSGISVAFIPQTQAQGGFVGLSVPTFDLLAVAALVIMGLLVALLFRRTGGTDDLDDPGPIWPPERPLGPSQAEGIYWDPATTEAIERGSPPSDYYEGLSVGPPPLGPGSNGGNGSASVLSAYPIELPPAPEGVRAPMMLEVSPTMIHLATVPARAPAQPIEAEFTNIEPGPASAVRPTVTDSDAERLIASLILRPRSADGLKQESDLSDEYLMALIEGMKHAGLIVEGKQAATGHSVYALTPLAFRLAQRALPAGPAPGPTGRPAPAVAPVSLSQRVVLHLYGLGSLREDEVAPSGFTQAGMAAAFQRPPGTFAKVLQRLEEAGVLMHDTRHVQAQKRRLKVYRLTARGEGLAKELRRQGLRWPPP
jgi:YVTN family beta-propeller protein